ncbi:DUF5686 family protein [Roseivirga sp. BDSF3-8]|uniref:DUF5686 and carboxypeptidase-like regulatory domain-containing protein n=1 Tax=Roseivirga sp. BDSF3-8 TaxID=3241598 RepID=UPI00353228F9
MNLLCNRYFSRKIFSALLISILLVLSGGSICAQILITGRVTDAETGDPIPFANIVFTGTTEGGTTDFDGYYKIRSSANRDSVTASFVGYVSRTKAVSAAGEVSFQLVPDVISLDEVVVRPGINPAFAIIDRASENSRLNDKRELDAFDYESYTKIEMDISRMSEDFQQKKFIRKVKSVLDSVKVIAGEDGNPILPVFISESISRYYYRNDPVLKKEHVLKTKITGVGVDDGSLVSQLIGSSFQEYNFYKNWVNIAGKEFISPIADGWKLYYDYDLVDSLMIEGDYCYRLEVYPLREQDLAFTGTIWITKEEAALKQLKLTVPESANLNFIKRIDISQQFEQTSAGPWLPVKTRLTIDVDNVGKESVGFLAKFYNSVEDVKIGNRKPVRFYEVPIEVEPDAGETDEVYWLEARHDSLTATEMDVIEMIDTLRNIPSVRRLTNIVKTLSSGYIKSGKVDIGPYPLVYNFNNVEGHRLGLGFRTNAEFSKRWEFSAYGAYGLRDEEWKYRFGAAYFLNRKKWTKVSVQRVVDIDQLGLQFADPGSNPIFYSFTRFGELTSPYYYSRNTFSFQTDIYRGFTLKAIISNGDYDPVFPFAYYENSNQSEEGLKREFSTTEATIEARFTKNELLVINDNSRISMGSTTGWPVITLAYSRGFNDLLGGDFDYNRINLQVEQSLKMGLFGVSRYNIDGGYIFENLPYPLLRVHLGNESPFYTTSAFNQMDFFEFVSDSYLSLNYRHYFEGFLLNRIPLMKKLKWRALATANILYGKLDEGNLSLTPQQDADGNDLVMFRGLGKEPYIELGYGVENIFKLLRVDFIHRVTYLDEENVRPFGIKVSAQLIL